METPERSPENRSSKPEAPSKNTPRIKTVRIPVLLVEKDWGNPSAADSCGIFRASSTRAAARRSSSTISAVPPGIAGDGQSGLRLKAGADLQEPQNKGCRAARQGQRGKSQIVFHHHSMIPFKEALRPSISRLRKFVHGGLMFSRRGA